MNRKIALRSSVEQENAIPRDLVVVRVPATSANIGPGYDCLGAAVDMWSEVTVERSEKFEIVATGDGAAQMPLDEEVGSYLSESCESYESCKPCISFL